MKDSVLYLLAVMFVAGVIGYALLVDETSCAAASDTSIGVTQ